MVNSKRWPAVAMLAIVILATPRQAFASDSFPQVMEKAWGIGRLPVGGKGCQLCHRTEAGGRNTITKPFGLTLFRRAGVVQKDTGSLLRGLGYVVSNRTNSDGDAVSDYDEIRRDGTDPNDAKSFVVPPPKPPEPTAGEGGAGGADGSAGAGGSGDPRIIEPEPTYSSPPPSDLPAPFYHGCTLTPHGGSDPSRLGAWLAVGLGALSVRRAARRRTTP